MRKLFELINRNFFLDLFRTKMANNSPDQPFPLITLSREKGWGGRPIAHLVAKKLRKPWKVFHEQIVDEIAKETHLERQLVKEIDESNISLIEEVIDDFFGKRYLNLNNYYQNLVKIMTTIGHRGHAIIVGRGANFLFPYALKVRTICEMKQRIEWMIKYEKISAKEAVERIEESDQKRIEFVKNIYHHDPRKAHHYDLVIRTGKMLSIEDASELIVVMAKRRFKL